MIPIFTAAWSALCLADRAGRLDVLPTRISQGVPRFWPEARGFPALESLMPDRQMMRLSAYRFWPAYTEKLEAIGAEEILRQLHELYEAQGRPLGFCCFERSRDQCHRGPRGLAGFLEREAGIVLPEWEPVADQLTLDVGGSTEGRRGKRLTT